MVPEARRKQKQIIAYSVRKYYTIFYYLSSFKQWGDREGTKTFWPTTRP